MTRINKEQIKQVCIQKQDALIESYKQREQDLKNDIYTRRESASQSEDRNTGKAELLAALGNELVFAQQEMGYLNLLDVTNESICVEPGAVVITNHLNFFIGVSSEKVEVEGVIIYGISTKAPIYASMLGLEKGGSFQFNETSYIIEDMY